MLPSQARLFQPFSARNRLVRYVLCISASLALFALSEIAPAAQQEEILLGYRATAGLLIFHVTTHGCTDRKDFRVVVVRTDTNRVKLTLYRCRADDCKGFFREGTEIFFSRRELGLSADTDVKIMNQQVHKR